MFQTDAPDSVKVLVTGIGGSIGIDVARSLSRDPSIALVGTDGSPWGRRIGERLCSEVHELPRADHQPTAFADALDDLIETLGIDFTFVNPDPELEALSALERLPAGRHGLPAIDVTALCLDKEATARAIREAGLKDLVPHTLPIGSGDEVEDALAELGLPAWIRATVGPGGKGSLPVEKAEEARFWMRYWQRRGWLGDWMAQEYLPGRNFNWTGLFVQEDLVAEGAMERLGYFLSAPAASGISGQVSLCKTMDPEAFRRDLIRAVRAVDPHPEGIYSVDLREDSTGRAKITEINPRLAGRPALYTRAGVNLPLAAVRALRGQDPGDALDPDGLLQGVHLHRQLDVDPVFGYADGTPDDR